MAFIPVENTCQCELIFLLDGQFVENTLYFERAGAWTVEDAMAYAETIYDWWVAELSPNTSSAVTLQRVRMTDLSAADALSVEYVPVTPANGGNASPALPNNVTMTTTFATAGRGRSSRGRNYYVQLTEADVAANVVLAARVASAQGAYAALMIIADGDPVDWVVVSRYHNNAPRVTGETYHITSTRTNNIVDSQRRRLPGRGS